MREVFEELKQSLLRDLDDLFFTEQGMRYRGAVKHDLEKALDDIKHCLNIMDTISMYLNDYYDDISDGLVERENDNAV